MKRMVIIFSLGVAVIGAACGNSAPQAGQTQTNQSQNSANNLVVSSHTGNTESPSNQIPVKVPKSDTKTKWTQSGDPIDVASFDSEIAKAEKDVKTKPKDEAARKAMAEAYIKRAVALTNARQYASALGDYRRALKYDEKNEEAKKWIDQIVGIYQSMNREAPKEGEEPPPIKK